MVPVSAVSQLIMDETKERLHGVIRDVQALRSQLETTRMGCYETETKLKSFENHTLTLKQETDGMNRRTNILIDGIVDETRENWGKSEVKQMLLSNVGLAGTNIDTERAQRIGQC